MGYKLGRIDRKIATHLQLNGNILDQVGKELTVQFLLEALKTSEIKDASRHYGFTLEDLCLAYTAMVECVMPNPLVKDPSGLAPMLCASLQFMEPFRIESIMGSIHQKLPPGVTSEDRKIIIVEEAKRFSEMTWLQHKEMRGTANFEIERSGTGSPTSGGCSCLILIGFLVLIPVGSYVVAILT